MNLTQIKAAYLVNLNEKTARCFDNIEKAMVSHFREIESGKDIIMGENYVNGDSRLFAKDYKTDIIKEIKRRYAENWDIIYVPESKKKQGHFIFCYKGQPAGYVSHIEHRDTIIISKEEPVLDRTQILDLNNE